jgi:hypothetical protein
MTRQRQEAKVLFLPFHFPLHVFVCFLSFFRPYSFRFPIVCPSYHSSLRFPELEEDSNGVGFSQEVIGTGHYLKKKVKLSL